MRSSQLSVTPKIRLAAVPIICRCKVPVDPNRNKRFTTAVTVTVNGMIIGDAEVYPQNYTPDTSAIELDLLCTVPIFTKVGLIDAIEQKAVEDRDIWIGHEGRCP